MRPSIAGWPTRTGRQRRRHGPLAVVRVSRPLLSLDIPLADHVSRDPGDRFVGQRGTQSTADRRLIGGPSTGEGSWLGRWHTTRAVAAVSDLHIDHPDRAASSTGAAAGSPPRPRRQPDALRDDLLFPKTSRYSRRCFLSRARIRAPPLEPVPAFFPVSSGTP